MIEITNENELLKILGVISEEAVRLSKKNLNEAGDPYADEYNRQHKEDEILFGSLSEQEEEEAGEEEDIDAALDDLEPFGEDEPAEEDDEAEPTDDDLDVEDVEEDEDEGESEEATDFGVSFDSVLSAINNLRAGKSLKDSSIKDQASAYYDRLDDAERKVLLVFLQQFSEILSGAVQGSEADDPSDAPYNMTITDAEEDEDVPAEDDEFEDEPEEVITDEEPAAPEDFDMAPAEEPAEEEQGEEEDLTPPIRVNESQDLKSLRRKIRRIMLRG